MSKVAAVNQGFIVLRFFIKVDRGDELASPDHNSIRGVHCEGDRDNDSRGIVCKTDQSGIAGRWPVRWCNADRYRHIIGEVGGLDYNRLVRRRAERKKNVNRIGGSKGN